MLNPQNFKEIVFRYGEKERKERKERWEKKKTAKLFSSSK